MKMTHWLAAASATVLVAGASFAQIGSTPQVYSEMVPPDKGTAEVGIAFNAVLHQSGGGTSQSLNLRYLPYLNRNVQVGGGLAYSHVSGGDTFTSIEAVANYNFMPQESTAVSRTVPYAGAAIGTSHVKTGGNSDNVSHWGLQGGVKQFISNDVSLFAEINYRKYNKGNGNQTLLLIGLNTYLR
ncbi:MAG TPA: outer membrane beta-barrel protein [Armatimonadota bacterium]|jgi:opacity protein-like surface antigen